MTSRERVPSEEPAIKWSPERFNANPEPKLVQVGTFLRNSASILFARPPPWLGRAQLGGRKTQGWMAEAHIQCIAASRHDHPDRFDDGKTQWIDRLDDREYDKLLSANIVFLDLLAAVATNAVIESIARNTPIVLNRHPGPLSYLPGDYPLYYEQLEQLPELITRERVWQAHEYLRRMDKSWLRGEFFCDALRDACLHHVPELAAGR